MRKLVLAISMALGALAASGEAAPLWKSKAYDAAIIAARQGNTRPALQMLEQEAGKGPLAEPLLNDYITLLCWDQQYAKAIKASQGREDQLHADTLRLLAANLRGRKEFANASRLYGLASVRGGDISTSIQQAMSTAEGGDITRALDILNQTNPVSRDDALELTRARAYVLMLHGDQARALDYIQDNLQRYPADPVLTGLKQDVLTRLGLPDLDAKGGAELSEQDKQQILKVSTIELKGAGDFTTETYKRLIPAASFFNNYVVLLSQKNHLRSALEVAGKNPALLTRKTLAVLQQVADQQGQPAQRDQVRQWISQYYGIDGDDAGTLTDSSEVAPVSPELAEVRAHADALRREGAYAQALVYLSRWQSRYADDPVLNAQYRSVLANLQMLDAQHSLLDRPALPGQVPRWSLDQQRGLQAIEWAQVRADLDEVREMQQLLDQALEQNARWLNAPGLSPAMQVKTIDVRLQLLQRRGRPEDTVQLFEQHPQAAYSASAYGAVAASYLVLKQPEKAAALFRKALDKARHDDPKAEWQVGLAYAQLESGQYKTARNTMADALRTTPRSSADPLTGTQRFNPDYLSLAYHQAMITAFLGDVKGAQQQMDSLLDLAPFAAQSRIGMSQIALLLESPTTTKAMLKRLAVDDGPEKNWDVMVGQVEADLARQDFQQARRLLDELETMPVDSAENRLKLTEQQEQYRALMGPELVVDAGHDLGSSQGASMHNAYDSQTRLYSATYNNLRVFAQHQFQTADFTSTTGVGTDKVRFETAGLGLQYRSQYGTGEIGGFSQLDGHAMQGGFAGFDWTVNDNWMLGLRYEKNSMATPLEARQSGVYANLLLGKLEYKRDDLTTVEFEASQMDFTDTNRRQGFALTVNQTLIKGPIYQLNGILEASTNHNDVLDNAIYYSPHRDLDTSLTLMNDITLWRYYDNSFHQRIGISGGRYYETAFGSKNTWAYTIEQVWDFKKGGEIRYGFSRSMHPYDGVSDGSNRIYLFLDWKMK
jgi:biofilm PGA synthesis protein PgaA